jgi:hypothetical protein
MLSELDKQNRELEDEYFQKYATPLARAWSELMEEVPELHRIVPRNADRRLAPPLLADHLFYALMVCFADPLRREVLRSQMLHLLKDDLKAILDAALYRE